jgi:hypothetical protein
MKIKRLRCRVRVRTARKVSPQHQAAAPPRPSLLFAMPQGTKGGEEMPAPSQTATKGDDREHGGVGAPDAAKRADAGAVSERVYELMREELRLAQLRSGREWN